MDLIDGKTITIISSSIVAIAGAVVGTLFGVGVFKADKANVYEIGAGEIKITSGFVLDEFPVDDTESIEYQNAKDALIKAALAVLEAAAPDLIKNVTEDDVIITIEEQEVFVGAVDPDKFTHFHGFSTFSIDFIYIYIYIYIIYIKIYACVCIYIYIANIILV